MMTIRAAQVEAFRAHRRQHFMLRLSEYLALLPASEAQGWGRQRVEQEAEAAFSQAAQFHLKRETDIARLAEIFCTRQGGFSGQPVAREGLAILQAYGVDPGIKLDRFSAYLDQLTGSSV